MSGSLWIYHPHVLRLRKFIDDDWETGLEDDVIGADGPHERIVMSDFSSRVRKSDELRAARPVPL